jgi:hypothetical protein
MKKPFRIVLNGLRRLPNFSIVVSEITRVFTPIAKQAGRTLDVAHGAVLPQNRARSDSKSDLVLSFIYTKPLPLPGKIVQSPSGYYEWFGNTDGSVFIYAIRNFRMGGGPRPNPARPRVHPTDYYYQIQRVFNTNKLVAKAAAVTAVHELGHMIAKLPDTIIPTNFMFAGRPGGTLKARQLRLAGSKAFTSEQIRKLAEAIKTGKLGDDVKIKRGGQKKK